MSFRKRFLTRAVEATIATIGMALAVYHVNSKGYLDFTSAEDTVGVSQTVPISASATSGARHADVEFDGDLRLGQLQVLGAGFTSDDLFNVQRFMPYNFIYQRNRFVGIPSADFLPHSRLYRRHNRDFETASSVLNDSCINPRPDNTAKNGVIIKNPIVCMMRPQDADGEIALIGVVQPADNALFLTNADATCRGEVDHWQSLPEFFEISVAFCIVVDRPYDPLARKSEDWMNVIIYKRSGNRLITLGAGRRSIVR